MPAQFSIRLNDDLESRLEEFRDAQTVKPTKSDVVRTALDEFLDEQGF